jgi:nucleoid-associated protein YgaU
LSRDEDEEGEMKPHYFKYKLRKGDTLWGLARAHLKTGTRWEEITDSEGNTISEEQVWRLPTGMVVLIPQD